MAWNFFADESRDEFRRGLPFDDATRARGWALWTALIPVVRERDGGEGAGSAAHRWGRASGPREVIGLILADHSKST